jgi:hypothetical protein
LSSGSCCCQAADFDDLTADVVLNDWEMQLALLEPDQRELARLSPPVEVVAAMARSRPTGWSAALTRGAALGKNASRSGY